ncbi:MAG: PKD domain-containing protein [Promethearchaeota archaeon]
MAVFFTPTINATNASDPTPETSTDYEDSSSIAIYDDDDLTAFPGAGDINSPYVITNYNFTNDPNDFGLMIRHTTKYILISNCYFDMKESSATGVYLVNVTNIAISSCIFTTDNSSSYSSGIKIWNCTNVDIGGNSITEFGYENGILIMNNSTNIDIHNNYIAHCWTAIESNTIVGEMTCVNLTIRENWLEFNYGSMYLWKCHNLTIINNIINKAGNQYNQQTNYIWITQSTDYQTINNTIYYLFLTGSIHFASHLRANESVILWFDTTTGRGPYTYQWDFGDGSVNGTDQVVNHEYVQTGTYNVTVTVTDTDGEVYVRNENIYINVPCIAACPNCNPEETSKISGYSIPLFIFSGLLAIIFLRKRFRAN